ncbi:amidase family protein [Blastococcus sp. SYSU D00820]
MHDSPGGNAALLARIRSGELSAVEAVGGALRAAEEDRSSPVPLASVLRTAPGALAEAAEIDRRRARGEELPPLAGLPITVKDAFDVAGLVSGHGVPGEEHLAATDAPAVAALRAAGCVVVGKTTVPARLADVQAGTDAHGWARNPADRTRTAGGSSGGAAAVVAGQSRLDLGSDMVGSVRMPAGWCGTAALRPTLGLVSKRGHLPWPPHLRLEPPASTVGLIAPSAADLWTPFEALLAGAGTGRAPVAPGRRSGRPRLGLWLPDDWPVTGGETRRALLRWSGEVAGAGCDVVPVTPPRSGRAEAALYARLTAAEIAHGAGDLSPARPLLADLEEQAAVVDAWRIEVFGAVDALLCPVTPVVAPAVSAEPLDRRTVVVDGRELPAASLMDWSVLTSVAHCPSVVLPAGPGDESGLPVGVQLLGAPGTDLALLDLACELEALVPVPSTAPALA